jgi:hypothetical protein
MTTTPIRRQARSLRTQTFVDANEDSSGQIDLQDIVLSDSVHVPDDLSDGISSELSEPSLEVTPAPRALPLPWRATPQASAK